MTSTANCFSCPSSKLSHSPTHSPEPSYTVPKIDKNTNKIYSRYHLNIYITEHIYSCPQFHPPRLSVNTKHQCYKHRVHLSSCCSPALCQPGTRSARRVQHIDPCLCCGCRSDKNLGTTVSDFTWLGHREANLSISLLVWPDISQQQPKNKLD